MSDTINIKESLLKVVNDNNLEILKIDLYNEGVSFAKYANIEQDKSCKTYTTLESLDFEEDSCWWGEEVLGTVYCQDKDTKEPVWNVLISPEAVKKLLQGDLDWLLQQPDSLEKDHIEAILKKLIKRVDEGKPI